MSKITVKRMVPLFTIITDDFKKGLINNTSQELKLIDNQINGIQNQIKELQGYSGLFNKNPSKTDQNNFDTNITELNEKLERIKNLKKGLMSTLDDIKNKPNGTEIQTGMIETFVDLQKGDNIRKIFERARIVIKDDIIQDIVE